MAYRTELIHPQELQDKHYFRKHGANAVSYTHLFRLWQCLRMHLHTFLCEHQDPLSRTVRSGNRLRLAYHRYQAASRHLSLIHIYEIKFLNYNQDPIPTFHNRNCQVTTSVVLLEIVEGRNRILIIIQQLDLIDVYKRQVPACSLVSVVCQTQSVP